MYAITDALIFLSLFILFLCITADPFSLSSGEFFSAIPIDITRGVCYTYFNNKET